jgi:hypothetical protein
MHESRLLHNWKSLASLDVHSNIPFSAPDCARVSTQTAKHSPSNMAPLCLLHPFRLLWTHLMSASIINCLHCWVPIPFFSNHRSWMKVTSFKVPRLLCDVQCILCNKRNYEHQLLFWWKAVLALLVNFHASASWLAAHGTLHAMQWATLTEKVFGRDVIFKVYFFNSRWLSITL